MRLGQLREGTEMKSAKEVAKTIVRAGEATEWTNGALRDAIAQALAEFEAGKS
jgi:hypothetical protein